MTRWCGFLKVIRERGEDPLRPGSRYARKVWQKI